MPLVNRDNTSDPLWGQWPETATPSTSGAGPALAEAKRPAGPENVVQRSDDSAPWGDDSTFEAAARATIEGLHPGDHVKLNVKAELNAGESIGIDADANVERMKDGSVVVELNAKADLGIGEGKVSARIGVAAGTKFHFQTAAQAADFLDAFAKEGALVASHLDSFATSARALGVKGDVVDAQERLLSHLGNISELKGDLVGTAKLGAREKLFGFEEMSASADLQLKHGFKVDLEKGTFTLSESMGVGGKTNLKLPFLDMSAGARGTLSHNATWKLSAEQLHDLKAGTLSPLNLARKLTSTPDEVSVKCELELSEKAGKGGTVDTREKVSIELPRNTKKLESLDPRTLLNELSRQKWKAEFDIGLGVGLDQKLDAKAGSIEVSGSFRHKEKLDGEFDLNTALAALRRHSEEATDTQGLFDARRAAANLR